MNHAEHLIKKKILFPCSNAHDVPVKCYITYIITSCCRYELLSWSNFYQLHVLVLTLCTHDIMIFKGMNDKWPSKNSFSRWISCAEGENDEMGIPNYRERSRLNCYLRLWEVTLVRLKQKLTTLSMNKLFWQKLKRVVFVRTTLKSLINGVSKI